MSKQTRRPKLKSPLSEIGQRALVFNRLSEKVLKIEKMLDTLRLPC